MRLWFVHAEVGVTVVVGVGVSSSFWSSVRETYITRVLLCKLSGILRCGAIVDVSRFN